MTGYGIGTVDLKIKGKVVIPLSIEIKALNSRFFELTTRLPKSLSFSLEEILIWLSQG